MSVTAERELHVRLRQYAVLPRPRVMLHKHHESPWGDTRQRLTQVRFHRERSVSTILFACHHDRVGATSHRHMAVKQQPPAITALLSHHCRVIGSLHTVGRSHIHAVVMVAEHGKHPVARTQPPEQFAVRSKLRRLHILQVTSHHHSIGVLGVNAIYCPRQETAVH